MAKNMAKEKVKMPELDPNIRNKNFEEVAQGYTEAMALEEAARCLNCKNTVSYTHLDVYKRQAQPSGAGQEDRQGRPGG